MVAFCGSRTDSSFSTSRYKRKEAVHGRVLIVNLKCAGGKKKVGLLRKN